MRITDKINLARIADKLRRYHGETSTRETFGVASGRAHCLSGQCER